MKKVLIVGSGMSGITVADTLINKKLKIYLVDTANISENKEFNYTNINTKNSPKLSSSLYLEKNKLFLENYNFKKNTNFFTTSTLISGGGANFWGGALEIPSKKYQNNLNKRFKINLSQSFNYLIKILCPNQKITKGEIYNKILFSGKKFKIKKFYQALSKNNFVDKWYEKNRYKSFSLDSIFKKFLKRKNFFYIPNTVVKKINLKHSVAKVITNNKKLNNIAFDKIIISCGSIASPILLKKSFPDKFPNEYRLNHTPMVKIAYFNFSFISKLKTILFNTLTNLPQAFLDIKIKRKRYLGSFVLANQYPNFLFGFGTYNIFFSWIKKFLIVGNLFANQNYSKSYLKISNSLFKNEIKVKKNKVFIDKFSKKVINKILFSFGYLPIPIINFSKTYLGTDSHYTSTLYNFKKYNYSFSKNKIYVLDGSILPPGLYYTTFTTLALIRELTKKIKF